ncbi:MAG: NAD-dependent epimerase/dehydratase family protein [Fimbriimonadaceae bacterium]
MKVLVTGGAGFIGSNVVELLLERGHEPTVLDNLSTGYATNLREGVPFIEADVRDSGKVDQACDGTEVVFHLAASVGNRRSIRDPREDAEINMFGTINVLDAARKNGVRKVVYSSSAGIFGELKQLPIDESHPIDPDTPYGASKLAGEKECLAYAKCFELEAVCLRYFNVYGVNQRYDEYGNVMPIFLQRLLEDRPLTIYGDGMQTRDFINVKDVALANVLAGENQGTSGAFNLGCGSSITINYLAELCFEAFGKNTGVDYQPPRLGEVLHSEADISAINKALGFAPGIPMREGVQEYVDWAKTAFQTA